VTVSVTLCPAASVPPSVLSSSRPDEVVADQDSAVPSAVIVSCPDEALPSRRAPGDTSRLPRCGGPPTDTVGCGDGSGPRWGGRPLALAVGSGWVSLTNSCSPGLAASLGEADTTAVGVTMGAAASAPAPARRGPGGPTACAVGSRLGVRVPPPSPTRTSAAATAAAVAVTATAVRIRPRGMPWRTAEASGGAILAGVVA
jgi:hypothetical protein